MAGDRLRRLRRPPIAALAGDERDAEDEQEHADDERQPLAEF
jgi:hypothetical protein